MDTARSYTDAYAVAYTYSLRSIERLYLLVGLAVMSDSKIYALVWPYIDVDEKLFPLFWCRILGLMVWLVVQNLLYNSAHAIGFNKRMAVIWFELYSFQYFKNFEMPREQDDRCYDLQDVDTGLVKCVCVCVRLRQSLGKEVWISRHHPSVGFIFPVCVIHIMAAVTLFLFSSFFIQRRLHEVTQVLIRFQLKVAPVYVLCPCIVTVICRFRS